MAAYNTDVICADNYVGTRIHKTYEGVSKSFRTGRLEREL